MRMTRRQLLGTMGACLFPLRASARDVQSQGGLAFGSSWRITTDTTNDLVALRPVVQAIIDDVDRQMSPYRATSDLSAFNRSKTTEWQPKPSALRTVAAEALEVARMTNGHFDPTVGPTVARFGFGPIVGEAGSYKGIETNRVALRKSAPGLTLDLCGIAKGFALDRIVDDLTAVGVRDAFVEVGGEVRALGHHPDGRPWTVAIADPRVAGFRAFRIITPGPGAIATSGNTSNGITGRIGTGHIISPKSDRPASQKLLSVTVLSASAMRSDALATALFAAGPEKGVRLARRLGIAALFVAGTPTNPVETATGDFDNHILA